eukprot:2963243-Prymnesium_polylepis.1
MDGCCRGVPAALKPVPTGSPRPARDRVRCLRCTRVDGRHVDPGAAQASRTNRTRSRAMSSTLRACEGVPCDVSTCVLQPLH